MDELRTRLLAEFLQAERAGFPAFPAGIERSGPLNALPHACDIATFVARAPAWPGRDGLVARVVDGLADAADIGIAVEFLLVGGSFTDLANAAPADIDAVWLYRALGTEPDVDAIGRLQQRLKAGGADARLIPLDGDPLVLLMAVSFFSVLYTHDLKQPNRRRGLLLVDCRPRPLPEA